MSQEIIRKTLQYERKLIRRLLQTDQQLKAIYGQYADQTSEILSRYRAKTNGIIIRDPDLDKQLAKQTVNLKNKIKETIETGQVEAWKMSNEKNDEIIYGALRKAPQFLIAKKGLFDRNEKAFLAFQQRKYEGMGLSDRVWNLADGNQKLLEGYLENGLSSGKSAQQISIDIRQLLKEPDKLFRRVRDENGKLQLSESARAYTPEPGMYRSSAQNAMRLARTEVNMAYRTADQQRWKGLDFVLGYEVVLSDQHPVPDICDEAAGRYPKNFVFVGWHPNCMCYTIPILPSDEDFMDNLVDGKELSGRVNDVPEGLKNWVDKNSEKISGWKSQPFFIRDNFEGGRIEGGLSL